MEWRDGVVIEDAAFERSETFEQTGGPSDGVRDGEVAE